MPSTPEIDAKLAEEVMARQGIPLAPRKNVSPDDERFNSIALALGSQLDVLERSLGATRIMLKMFIEEWARQVGAPAVPTDQTRAQTATELLRRRSRPVTFNAGSGEGNTADAVNPTGG